MAHSPKKKAAAVADLALGMTVRAVASKHGVGVGTVGEWASELNSEQTRTENERLPLRHTAFQEAFYQCLEEITKAMIAFAQVCQEKEWVKTDPSGASDLAVRTTDFADRIMARARAQADEPAAN